MFQNTFRVLFVLLVWLVPGKYSNAQQSPISPDWCEDGYFQFLESKKMYGTITNLIETRCPEFVPTFIYTNALIHTQKYQKLQLLFSENLPSANNPQEKISLRLISQDTFFRLSDYLNYRLFHPRLDAGLVAGSSIHREDIQNALLNQNLTFRYINVDLLFALRAWDLDYLKSHQPLLNNSEVVIYPEVRRLYLKAFDVQKKIASPPLAAIFSTILPGSGRLLYGKYYDAFNSAFLVFGSSYLTYKHFDDTPFNLIFGGVASVFYISNIIGSYIGAVNANNANRIRIQYDANSIYYTFPDYTN